MKLLTVIVSSVLAGLAAYWVKLHGKVTMMRFFRDVSRYKARRRLYGNTAALIPLLLGTESQVLAQREDLTKEAAEELVIDVNAETPPLSTTDDSADFTLTLEELSLMNGATETAPVYVSIKGLVFDVSAARELYGPGKAYHALVGRDATKAYATGCLEEECARENEKLSLSAEHWVEVDRWLDFYKNHDKYEYVGRLVSVDPVESLVDQALHSSEEINEITEEEHVASS